MYRLMSFAVLASLFSFTAAADCSSCKGNCDKNKSSEALIETSVQVDLEEEVVLGQKSAEHTIVFYTDAECSFCHKAYQNLQVMREKWKDKLNIVVKQSPHGHHEKAKDIARYTLALRNQSESMAVQFTEYLYKNPKSVKAGSLHWQEIAQSFHADLELLRADLSSSALEEKLESELEQARSIGVRATPSFVIAGQLITGNRSVEELENFLVTAKSKI